MPTFLAGDAANFSRDGSGLLWLPDSYLQLDLSGASGFTSQVPAGITFSRGATIDSVQTGTSKLVLQTASTANTIKRGRKSDSWGVWPLAEESRPTHMNSAFDMNDAQWVVGGTVTRTAGRPDPLETPGTGAWRIQAVAASGANMHRLKSGLAYTSPQTASLWMRPTVPSTPVAVLCTGVGNGIGYDLAPTDWVCLDATEYANAGGGSRIYTAFSTALGAFPAGDRDWDVYGAMFEPGAFPTSLIPVTAGAVTRPATLWAISSSAWTPWITQGRLAFEIGFRAMGARTEYSGNCYLFHSTTGVTAVFAASTGVLTLTVGGSSNTCTLPTWPRHAVVRMFVALAGGIASEVFVQVNGTTQSLPITGSPLGAVTGGQPLYFTNPNTAAANLSCWIDPTGLRIWRRGRPPWTA